MGSSHRPEQPPHASSPAHTAATDQATAFLRHRLTEDLARLWSRAGGPADGPADWPADWRRPGLVTQLAIIEELLGRISSGRLPPPHELRILLCGYGAHPAYDPGWTDLLVD